MPQNTNFRNFYIFRNFGGPRLGPFWGYLPIFISFCGLGHNYNSQNTCFDVSTAFSDSFFTVVKGLNYNVQMSCPTKVAHLRLVHLFVDIVIAICFGGLGVACWPLVPKFAGSNLAEAVGFLSAKKSSVLLPLEGNKAVSPMS